MVELDGLAPDSVHLTVTSPEYAAIAEKRISDETRMVAML
jgi:hypothetical protein